MSFSFYRHTNYKGISGEVEPRLIIHKKVNYSQKNPGECAEVQSSWLLIMVVIILLDDWLIYEFPDFI